MRRTAATALAIALLSWTLIFPAPSRANNDGSSGGDSNSDPAAKLATKTPIKHLVVIFDENNSFDHYFGTYPHATNPSGETPFYPDPETPAVNGLTPTLLNNNPNQAVAGNPFRLDPLTEASTSDNTNKYTPEQQAFDGGLLDKFNVTNGPASAGYYFSPNADNPSDLDMGYYDGNSVTALWNYAQHYAMSDNFFDSEFGGTVEGHLNLLSGQTNGLVVTAPTPCTVKIPCTVTTANTPVATTLISSNFSVVNNVQPTYDDCVTGPTAAKPNITMTGHNIGDLLNKAGVSWGWFYDGFAYTSISSSGVASCNSIYNSHYAPFEYWQSTSNPHHLPPSSVAAIGTSADQANHNYDLCDLLTPGGDDQCTAVTSPALTDGNLPAVTFIKPAKSNTGHPMDSTPLAEQTFLVNTINQLMESPYWKDMAIIIAYDDSDGWYDHVAGPIVNHSTDPANDAIQVNTTTGAGSCGALAAGNDNDRCGFGVRLPFVVISPFAKHNYVDHSLNDTTSIMRFIEYNWGLGTVGSLGIANDLQSYDVLASGSILGMFDFDNFLIIPNQRLVLDESTGAVVRWW